MWCPERPVKKDCAGGGDTRVSCWYGRYDGAENCLMDLVTRRSLVTLTKQFPLWVQERTGGEVGGSSTDTSFKELC